MTHMKCPSCGFENTSEAKFCPRCGSSLLSNNVTNIQRQTSPFNPNPQGNVTTPIRSVNLFNFFIPVIFLVLGILLVYILIVTFTPKGSPINNLANFFGDHALSIWFLISLIGWIFSKLRGISHSVNGESNGVVAGFIAALIALFVPYLGLFLSGVYLALSKKFGRWSLLTYYLLYILLIMVTVHSSKVDQDISQILFNLNLYGNVAMGILIRFLMFLVIGSIFFAISLIIMWIIKMVRSKGVLAQISFPI